MGQTGFCENLRFSAVSCENSRVSCENSRFPAKIRGFLRFSAKICASKMLQFPGKLRNSAKNCEFRAFVPFSLSLLQFPLNYRAPSGDTKTRGSFDIEQCPRKLQFRMKLPPRVAEPCPPCHLCPCPVQAQWFDSESFFSPSPYPLRIFRWVCYNPGLFQPRGFCNFSEIQVSFGGIQRNLRYFSVIQRNLG